MQDGFYHCCPRAREMQYNRGLTNMKNLKPSQPYLPFLLASDIDGTLFGDDAGEALLLELAGQYPGSMILACITGRPYESVVELVRDGHLPRPDFVCGSVGTHMVDCNDPDNRLGREYAAQVSPAWDLEAVYARGEGQGIRRQHFPEGQPPFQAGFDWDGQAITLFTFRERMAGLAGCHILVSGGMFIDVLPEPVGKGGAAQFLQRALGLDPRRVMVAGDGGNDVELFATGFQGAIPVNALAELKSVAQRPWHYHSPLPAARGVLDGLLHFGLVTRG
jgi:hydroxymethylpyrimidine pyrophosphatase-like HAD family hydrolase